MKLMNALGHALKNREGMADFTESLLTMYNKVHEGYLNHKNRVEDRNRNNDDINTHEKPEDLAVWMHKNLKDFLASKLEDFDLSQEDQLNKLLLEIDCNDVDTDVNVQFYDKKNDVLDIERFREAIGKAYLFSDYALKNFAKGEKQLGLSEFSVKEITDSVLQEIDMGNELSEAPSDWVENCETILSKIDRIKSIFGPLEITNFNKQLFEVEFRIFKAMGIMSAALALDSDVLNHDAKAAILGVNYKINSLKESFYTEFLIANKRVEETRKIFKDFVDSNHGVLEEIKVINENKMKLRFVVSDIFEAVNLLKNRSPESQVNSADDKDVSNLSSSDPLAVERPIEGLEGEISSSCGSAIKLVERFSRACDSYEKYLHTRLVVDIAPDREGIYKKLAALYDLKSTLHRSDITPKTKIENFNIRFKQVEKVFISRRDSHTKIFLKAVATVVTAGLASLMGIWKVKSQDFTKEVKDFQEKSDIKPTN